MSKAFGSIKTGLDQDDRVTFGKHSGNTWLWVMENFPDYIIWCVGNTDLKFSYQLIVDAIKSKYAIKKRTATEEKDGEYVPAASAGNPDTCGFTHDVFGKPMKVGHDILGRKKPDFIDDWKEDDIPF